MKLVIILMLMHSLSYAKNNEALPESITVDSKKYELCKDHTVRQALFIKVAYVGLYLQDCNQDENILQIADKLVRFNYQVTIKSSFFKEAAYDFFVKNLNDSPTGDKIAQLTDFNELYQDMKSDDCYDLYLKEGRQLKLYKNTELLGSSSDTDFSNQYFNIWFGQYPAIKKLKKAFLPTVS